jgi:chromosome partitioning protein
MRAWAVANQKGGVGKTTTAVSLGGLLAESGQPTLLMDLDPHASLTGYFGFPPDRQAFSVYNLFQGQISAAACMDGVSETGVDNLYLLTAAPAMATLDRQLGARSGMGLVLDRALANLTGHFERVIFDCPPTLGILMVNALAACDKLLMPTQTEFLALHGLDRMLRSIEMIQKARHIAVPHVIVPTLFDKRTRASNDSLDLLRERHGPVLAQTVVPIDTQLREASRLGVPLPLEKPNARASKAYRALLDELVAAETESHAELAS